MLQKKYGVCSQEGAIFSVDDFKQDGETVCDLKLPKGQNDHRATRLLHFETEIVNGCDLEQKRRLFPRLEAPHIFWSGRDFN